MYTIYPDDSYPGDRAAPGETDLESVFPGDGEMARIMRATDWSQTLLGPIERWPSALRMMCKLMLANRFPMLLWWGPQFLQIYNDAYRPILGTKHPQFLGRPVMECWSEIWDILGPLIIRPFEGGPATWMEDILLEVKRYDFTEETHFTIAYSPVPDETAPRGIGGVLATVHEITEKIVGERRSRALRDLGAKEEAKTAAQTCARAAKILANYPKDIPFLLMYLLDSDGKTARLTATAGIELRPDDSFHVVELGGSAPSIWPFAESKMSGQIHVVENLADRLGRVPPGPWSDTPTRAAVLAIQSNIASQPAGFLVAGLSSRLRFDDSYQGFLELLASQIAIGVANSRAYEEERKRAQALAEIDRAKTVFFTNVSHEFRTPLTLMLGPLEDTLGDTTLPPQARENLETVRRNSIRLHKLVNALLDFSRIEAGRIQAAFEPIDISAFTAALSSSFRSAVERAGLELVVDCTPLDQPVYIDREMWEKIVFNLLSNAFKFTLKGRISVSIHEASDGAILTVRDTGIGIGVEDMRHIFERFHRAKNALGRSFEGSGIGLALVQELVKQHGGKIQVESEPDKGSAFSIWIPFGSAHLPVDRIGSQRALNDIASTTSFVEEALSWLPDSASGTSELEVADQGIASAKLVERKRLRILVADDNADMRDYVRRLLSSRFDVETVPDGEAAFQSAIQQTPDLVLTDAMMPKLDGFGLLKALREEESTASVPVILLSARAGEESRVEGIRASADDYVVKPFSARELLARIEGCLALSRLRRETEIRVRSSEKRFRALMEASSDVVYCMSPDWVEMRFLRGREFIADTNEPSLSWTEKYIHPSDRAQVMSAIDEAIKSKSPFSLEHRVLRDDGSTGWTFSRAIPVLDDHGDIIEWFGAASDITDRKLIQEQIEEQNLSKDQFLALLGHELRNPLAAIDGAIQLLSGANAAERSNLDGLVNRQVQVLRRLVDDLLDLSRIEQGAITLQTERVDLAELLEAQALIFRAPVAAREQTLLLKLPTERISFFADRVRLEQMVANLLDNASKYTEPLGKIELSGAFDNSEIVVKCKDNGRGISSEIIATIFEPFKRGKTSDSDIEPGLGIGLALVKSLANLHGGTISVESESGVGSEFTLRLPWIEAPGESKSNGTSVRALRTKHSLSVALVEDNPDVAETRKKILEQTGYLVTVFADGASALSGIPLLKPAAALIDVGLPDMDGYELATKLRKTRELQDTKLIAISGFKRRTPPESSSDPFDHYFVKPVTLATLVAVLDACQHSEGPESPEAHDEQSRNLPLRLLLVEDHIGVAEATAGLARREGFEVRIAPSGSQGLSLAATFRPHLILCDLHLPDMSGRDMVRRLRDDPATRDIQSVILTASSEAEIQMYNDIAKKSGSNEYYLCKPLKAEMLRGLIEGSTLTYRGSPE